jgi:hypothetical protein
MGGAKFVSRWRDKYHISSACIIEDVEVILAYWHTLRLVFGKFEAYRLFLETYNCSISEARFLRNRFRVRNCVQHVSFGHDVFPFRAILLLLHLLRGTICDAISGFSDSRLCQWSRYG